MDSYLFCDKIARSRLFTQKIFHFVIDTLWSRRVIDEGKHIRYSMFDEKPRTEKKNNENISSPVALCSHPETTKRNFVYLNSREEDHPSYRCDCFSDTLISTSLSVIPFVVPFLILVLGTLKCTHERIRSDNVYGLCRDLPSILHSEGTQANTFLHPFSFELFCLAILTSTFEFSKCSRVEEQNLGSSQ